MRQFVGVALGCAAWVLLLSGVPPRGMAARAGGNGGASTAAQEPKKTPEETCVSCCYLPCIEAEMLFVSKARDVFQKLAETRNLTATAYVAEQARQLPAISQETRAAARSLSACRLKNLPHPTSQEDYQPRHYWVAVLGWKVQSVPGAPGGARYDFFVKTNENCENNDDQLAAYRKLMPCGGLADAVAAHEGEHVKQCEARKRIGTTAAPTPSQYARDEVGGYEAELKYLENLRRQASAECSSTPCKDQINEAEAKRLEAELKALKDVADRSRPSRPPRKRRTR